MEADLVKRKGISFTAIPAAGVHGVGLRALPGNLWRLGQGVLASRRVLRLFKPQAILFTGGYVAVPMGVAARLGMAGYPVPTLLYVPDIEPGLALNVLARVADRIALTAEDSRPYFSNRRAIQAVTGYPTRPELTSWNRASARKALELHPDRPMVLVYGGSKGAHSINRTMVTILPELLKKCQVVHITGQLEWTEAAQAWDSLPSKLASYYHPQPYIHDMGQPLAAADLAVTRAGASTLGELPLFGLPAILVPYPYAWRYQKVNAGYLEGHGAARVIEDAQLSERLLPEIFTLLDNPTGLEAMRTAMRQLSHPDAAQAIADQLSDLVSDPSSNPLACKGIDPWSA